MRPNASCGARARVVEAQSDSTRRATTYDATNSWRLLIIDYRSTRTLLRLYVLENLKGTNIVSNVALAPPYIQSALQLASDIVHAASRQ